MAEISSLTSQDICPGSAGLQSQPPKYTLTKEVRLQAAAEGQREGLTWTTKTSERDQRR